MQDNNVNFSFSDVRRLAYEWMVSLNRTTSMGCINATRKIEEMFKESDRFTEETEEQLLDEEDDVDSMEDEIDD